MLRVFRQGPADDRPILRRQHGEVRLFLRVLQEQLTRCSFLERASVPVNSS